MTVRADIDVSTIALQATIEEDEEQGGIVEDNLRRDGQSYGEKDLVDFGSESVSSFLGQDGVD